ncbi:hypothetical protein KQI88_10280 [Alkaliphilus sp. MSJ-5]|uniref:Uncharacterized protein n=1 Tax=Alkaliphilus flagellatus TaxID=2841507 RepID=A0ABS6G2U2_9FIRM|nr:hypothetical protein [Alkaliphilus flagellatus]MBU5676805.1 hypothetical protein [Alkaliphilus flagellatus]
MINFIIKNLDALIIGTIFLILGFLPTLFSSNKDKKPSISIDNTNVNNSNIGDSYNLNTYTQNYTENNYNNNQSTIIINTKSSTTNNNEDLFMLITGIVLFISLIFFYKHIDRVLAYLITITLSSLFLSSLLYKNLLKMKNDISIPNHLFNISIRNILSWVLLLINYIIIVYKINFSSFLEPFINLIKNLNIKSNNQKFSEIIIFFANNPYESLTACFIVIGLFLSIIIICQLFLSYIWIISYIKTSTNPISKLWNKIHSTLSKKEPNLNKKHWIYLFIILFSTTTGAIAYIFTLPTRMF